MGQGEESERAPAGPPSAVMPTHFSLDHYRMGISSSRLHSRDLGFVARSLEVRREYLSIYSSVRPSEIMRSVGRLEKEESPVHGPFSVRLATFNGN